MGLVAQLLAKLNPLIRQFVDPIQEDQVSLLPLLRGELRLERLQFNQTILAALGVPLSIDVSFIGRVGVRIPIANLLYGTTSIKVQNVLLVMDSVPPSFWDSHRVLSQIQATKEAMREDGLEGFSSLPLEGGFLWKIIQRLAHNVVVEIEDVEVRVEDTSVAPLAIGARIRKLTVKNQGPNRSLRSFDHSIRWNLLCETVTVDGVGVYIDQLKPEEEILRLRRSRLEREIHATRRTKSSGSRSLQSLGSSSSMAEVEDSTCGWCSFRAADKEGAEDAAPPAFVVCVKDIPVDLRCSPPYRSLLEAHCITEEEEVFFDAADTIKTDRWCGATAQVEEPVRVSPLVDFDPTTEMSEKDSESDRIGDLIRRQLRFKPSEVPHAEVIIQKLINGLCHWWVLEPRSLALDLSILPFPQAHKEPLVKLWSDSTGDPGLFPVARADIHLEDLVAKADIRQLLGLIRWFEGSFGLWVNWQQGLTSLVEHSRSAPEEALEYQAAFCRRLLDPVQATEDDSRLMGEYEMQYSSTAVNFIRRQAVRKVQVAQAALQPSKASFFARLFRRAPDDELEESLMRSVSAILEDIPSDQVVKFHPLTTGADFYLDLSLLRVNVAITVPQQTQQGWVITKSLEAVLDAVHLVVNSDAAKFKLWLGVEVYPLRVVLADLTPAAVDVYPVVVSRGAMRRECPLGDEVPLTREAAKKMAPVLKLQLELSTFVAPPDPPMSLSLQTNEPLAIIVDPSRLVKFGTLALIAMQVMDSMQTQEPVDRLTLQLAAWGGLYASRVSAGSGSHVNLNFQVEVWKPVAVLVTKDSGDLAKEALCLSIDSLSLQSDVQPTRDVYTTEIAAGEVTDEIRLRIEGLFLGHFTDAGECLSSIGIDHTLFAAFTRARSGSFISAAPACGVILEKRSNDHLRVRVCHDSVRRDVSTLHLDYWRDTLRVAVDESFVQYAVGFTNLVLSDLDLAMAEIDNARDAHTPRPASTTSSEDSSLPNMQPLEDLTSTPAFLGSLEVHVSILEIDVRLTTVADTGDSPLSRAILGVSVTKLAVSSSVDMKSQTMSSQVAVGNLQVTDLSGLSPVPLRCLLRGVRRQRVPSHCIELASGLVDINSLPFCEAATFLASDITAPFLHFSIYVDFVNKVQDLALLVRPLRVVLLWEYLDLLSTVVLRLLREAVPKVSEVSEEPGPLLADEPDDSALRRQLQTEMLTDQQLAKSTRINLRMKHIEVLISVAPCRPPSLPKTDRFSGWNHVRSGKAPLPRCLVFNASLSMDAKASHYTVRRQTDVRLPPCHGWLLGRPETSPRKRVEFELPKAPARADSCLDDLLPWLHAEPDDSFPTVHSLFRRNVIGPSLAFFCPSRVDITLDIDHVTLAFTNLEAASAISLRDLPWKKILNDTPVLQPFRATLSGTLFFPTPIMFFERLNGINRSVSLLARHSRGFLMPNHREGFYITVHVDPIHVNLTSPNLLDLITLASIGQAFSATMANQFPESAETSLEGASTGENYSSDDGGNDVMIAPEKPVVLGGLPLCLLAFEIEVDVTLESLVVVLKGGYTQDSVDKLIVALVDTAGLHLVIRSPYVASHNLERDWWFGMAHYARLLDCSYNAENMRSVSFDYDKLQNPMNFTRIRKRQRYIETHKRLLALLRRIGRALRGSAREGKQGAQFESILNKGVTEARRELLNSDKNLDNRAPAWIVLHGDITVSVDYKIPDEARHMSLVEPFVLSYVAGKMAPQHPLEVVSAMSWININLSVAVLDTLQQAMYRYVIVNHQARESMKVSALERLFAQDSDGSGHVVYPGFVSLGLDPGSLVYHFRGNEGFDVLNPLLQALDFESMVPGVSYATLKTRALSRLLPSGGLPGLLASEPSRGAATIGNCLGQVIGIRVNGNVKLVEDGSATSLTAAEMGDFKILVQLDRQVYILPAAWVDWTPGNVVVVTLRLRALQESRSYLDVLIRGLTPADPHSRQVVLTPQTCLRNLSGCAVIVQPRFRSEVFATAATEPECVQVAASEGSRDKPSRKWITFSSFVLDGISAVRRGPFAGTTHVHVPPESMCPLPLWWLFGSSTELLITLDEGSEGEPLLDPSILHLMGTCESRLQDDETDERSMNLNTYPSSRVNLTRGLDNLTMAVTLAVLSSARKKNASRCIFCSLSHSFQLAASIERCV
ncbi:MAG: hypothetical protein KVP17_002637 [Porospora cf. gigantea B]|uniref:uncharacterized protein n=1 Tax=Porospora cf. gigantea B TaxID=2853592 RepID=UPI003571EBB5|nr:MAG: hypothetical protein KVP17_002637 [Porospora cf. gigantea B]